MSGASAPTPGRRPPNPLHSLFGRLSLAFLGLMAVLLLAYVGIALYGARAYQQEVSQDLNRNLAENLIQDYGLDLDGGRYDVGALQGVFHAFMVVNPSIEVYLLDARGRILAYDAPQGRVQLDRVDLQPLQRFLRSSGGHPPITGSDPRDPQRRKVFSAAPIGDPAAPRGYLYVVLAGEQFDSVAGVLASSYILRLAGLGLLASLLLAALVGVGLLHHLTRRLRRLDDAIQALQARDFQGLEVLAGIDTRSGDEIGRLGRSITAMAARIQTQLQALRDTDDLRRELIANVSHDLRTPITTVKGYLETLKLKADTLSPVQRAGYLAIAIREAERLGRLVEELFELARLESGHTELQREPFPLGELVQDVVAKNRLWAESRSIRLRAEIPAGLPLVDADLGLIERLLQNLIDNALRHTPIGGEVRVVLSAQPAGVQLRVADTGEGIPPEALAHVFDRFYSVKRSERDRDRPGTGLGLAIARRIVELHQGRISVASQPRAGTRFDIDLPAWGRAADPG